MIFSSFIKHAYLYITVTFTGSLNFFLECSPVRSIETESASQTSAANTSMFREPKHVIYITVNYMGINVQSIVSIVVASSSWCFTDDVS